MKNIITKHYKTPIVIYIYIYIYIYIVMIILLYMYIHIIIQYFYIIIWTILMVVNSRTEIQFFLCSVNYIQKYCSIFI